MTPLSILPLRFSALSAVKMSLHDPLPHVRAEVVHQRHDDGDGDDLRAGGAVIEQVDVLLQEEADAATAGEDEEMATPNMPVRSQRATMEKVMVSPPRPG